MRKNSVKNRRINDEVQRGLAEIIRDDIHDPRISRLLSVVQVEVAPDLKTCRAYISVYGTKEDSDNTLEGLNSASGMIRSLLAKKVNLRNTPQIRFIMDDSIAYGVQMSHRIDEVTAMDRKAAADRYEPGPDGLDEETEEE